MRVLIVEDGNDVALRYKRELARHGFESQVAGDVATAKRLVEELTFDAALVDMGLPRDIAFSILRRPGTIPRTVSACGLALRGDGDSGLRPDGNS